MTKTLNQLTEITALADDDLLLARDVSAVEDFKITLANLKETAGINQNASDIGQRTIYVGSVSDLIDLPSLVDGQHYSLASFHPGFNALMLPPIGGGLAYWDENRDKADHNGGTIIDPDRTFPSDWSNSAQVSDWFSPATGAGCFVRQQDTGSLFAAQFGIRNNGSDDTLIMQALQDYIYSQSEFSSSSSAEAGNIKVELPAGDIELGTIVVHAPHTLAGQGWKTRIIPRIDIPDNGGVFVSLSGTNTTSGDETNNLSELEVVYGVGSAPARRLSYDLRGMRFEDFMFYSEAPRSVKAFWLTGFNRAASIRRVNTYNLISGSGDYDDPVGVFAINGSFVWSITDCNMYGSSTKLGIGINLATNNNGTHLGATVCNSYTISKNILRNFMRGLLHRRGSNARIVGNDIEACSVNGLFVLSGNAVVVRENYIEANDGLGVSFGLTSDSSDSRVDGLEFASNYLAHNDADTTAQVRIRNVRNSKVGRNSFSGSQATHYEFDGGSEFAQGNEFDLGSASNVSGLSSVSNAFNTIIMAADRTQVVKDFRALGGLQGNKIIMESATSTVSSDSTPYNSSIRRLVPFSGTSDDLINITSPEDDGLIIIGVENSGDTITVRHGTGNIRTLTGADVTLQNTSRYMMLIYVPSISAWVQVGGAT